MSESTVETTTNGPSLESILWAAAERWSDEPGLVDRDEFANYIFEAWGGESPTEEFVARFFDGDPTVAGSGDMAEAMSRASRRSMHVYNFDLNRLEYVIIEDADQVVLVSDQGQFALPNDDYLQRAIERAIIPDSKDPIGSAGEFDRKTDGTARAYFVRSSGEIVAVDVNQISKTVAQLQLDLKPVFSPVIDDAEGRLMPFNPVRTAMMPNREVDLLRQDERISSWTLPARKSLVARLGPSSNPLTADGGLAAPATADNAVLLLLPDGTLARPVIGSGSRWRDMVSDWTARAASISIDSTTPPDAVMDDRRYAIQTDRVVAVFTGVRPSIDSSDAPGELGLTSQTRGEAIAAVRMLDANIRILGDDDLAQAIMGGAQFVSGFAAPIMADTRPGTGFWLQPEVFFQPSTDDVEYASRELDLRSAGYSNAALETQLAAPSQEVVADGATSDPWSNWALQPGGDAPSGGVSTALVGRDVEGGTVSGAPDPSALALFARKGRMIGSPLDGSTSDFSALTGEPVRMPSERVVAFRAPDGALVFQPQANTQVRLASVHRSVGDASDASTPSPASASASAPAPRQFSASIGTRSGALPATALATLATALDRTAAASGYKLPRVVTFDSADDAIFVGEALSSSMSEYEPRRSRAMLTETPFLSGSVGRMVLSMPFPTTGEVVVGNDLDEALKAWMTAPAISVGDATSATSSGSSSIAGSSGSSGIMMGAFGGAASGAIAGGLALQSDSSSGSAVSSPAYSAPSLSNAALVSGSGIPAGAAPSGGLVGSSSPSGAPSIGGMPSGSFATSGGTEGFAPSTSALPTGSLISSGAGGVANFGSNAAGSPASSGVAGLPGSVANPALASGGSSYLVQSSAGAPGVASSSAPGVAGSLSSVDIGGLHGAALGRAQRASFALQMPAAAETLSSRATLARLPRLLARALEASGGWLPGSGTPLPSPVRDFALSGPFDLPELAAIGEFPEQEGPGLISTRVLNPGEEEISIPMPLWTQMGRGQLSSTEAVMASPRMRPGFAPPLGVYRLVNPETVDFTQGAPESTPGVVTLQGPTEMGLERSLAGGVEANKMGGQFVLGRIPVSDGETVVSRRGRIRIGAPLNSSDASSSLGGDTSALSSMGQMGSFANGAPNIGSAATGAERFGAAGSQALEAGSSSGNALASGSAFSDGSALSSSATLGGDAPAGTLVSGSPTVLRVPSIPEIGPMEMPDLGSVSVEASSSGRPFAGALQSALRMSDDVGGRVMPGASMNAPSNFMSSSGSFANAPSMWSNAGSMGGSGNLVAGQPMLSAGSDVASGVGGSGFGGGMNSLAASAPQGGLVASGGSSAGGSSLSALSSGADSSSSVASSASSAGGSSVASGLPPGAWSGAKRSDGGYTPWSYGSRFSPSEQSRGGVDLTSGSRLGKPSYPALPAMLRFRYIGAPLWWTSLTGSWAAGMDGARGNPDGGMSSTTMARSLRSGLSAANSAAAIWRSIFVAPGRQQATGPGGTSGSDAGTMDHTWDRNADDMASLSSKMALIAVGVGGGASGTAALTAGSTASSLKGPETVYVAMDSAGRAGTAQGNGKSFSPGELNMKIVAAIPPSPPPLADMAAASSTNVEVRPRHSKAASGHGDELKSGDEGVSRSKIEGSVDAIAQRIYHRIVRRLDSDRERFGG